MRSFSLGLLVGASYLPVCLHLLLGSDVVSQSSPLAALLLFPVCWSFFGFGTVLSFNEKIRIHFLLAILLLAALGFSLFIPISMLSGEGILLRATLLSLSAAGFYLLCGTTLGRQLKVKTPPEFSLIYGWFILGCATGGVFSDQAISYLGGNGILVFLILCCLFASLNNLPKAVAIILALVAAKSADLPLEALRKVDLGNHESRNLNYENPYLGHPAWSRHGLTYLQEHGKRIVGYINFRKTYFLENKRRRRAARKQIYSSFQSGQKIALIGAGVGSSLSLLDPEVLSPAIHLVERDIGTTRLAKLPEVNPPLSKVTYVAHDGRRYLESSSCDWDWIVVESAVDQTSSPSTPLSSLSLYTPEALKFFRDCLSKTGSLIVEFNEINGPDKFALFEVVSRVFEKLADHEFSASSFSFPMGSRLTGGFAILTRDPSVIKEFKDDDLATKWEESSPAKICEAKFSDRNPFLRWICGDHGWSWAYGIAIFLIFLVFCLRPAGRSRLNEIRLALFLQSVAQAGLFFSMSYLLRSVFVDELTTYYLLSFTSLIASALASFYCYAYKKAPPIVPTVIALIFFCALFLASYSFANIHRQMWVIRVLFFALLPGSVFLFTSLVFQASLQRSALILGSGASALFYGSLAIIPTYLAIASLLIVSDLVFISLLCIAIYTVVGALLFRTSR